MAVSDVKIEDELEISSAGKGAVVITYDELENNGGLVSAENGAIQANKESVLRFVKKILGSSNSNAIVDAIVSIINDKNFIKINQLPRNMYSYNSIKFDDSIHFDRGKFEENMSAFLYGVFQKIADTYNVPDQILENAKRDSVFERLYEYEAQKRADISQIKDNKVSEPENVRLDLDIYRETSLNEIEAATQEATKQISSTSHAALKSATDSLQEQINNALEGTKAEGILRQAFKLWETKEKVHRRNFYIGIGLFLALVVLAAIGLSRSWETIKVVIIDSGTGIPSGSGVATATLQMLSRIVLISLPFATVLWVLRATLRWANLNLSLAEDAAQRSVLAQTYVNLLSQGHIEQSEDRQIMLTALFRPLPGVKDLDIAPTTIKDIVDPKSGTKK